MTYIYIHRAESSVEQLWIDLNEVRQALYLNPRDQEREMKEIKDQIDRRNAELIPAQRPPSLSVWARGYRAT